MSAAQRFSHAADFVRARDWWVQAALVLVAAGAYAGRAAPGFLARLAWVLVMESLLVAAGYMANDAFDAATDIGKRDEAATPGYGTRKLAAAALAIIAGLAMAWALEPAKRWLVVAQIVFGLGYSAPGIRLKERGILGLAAAASLQRLPAFALAIEWPPRAPGLATSLGVWLLALGLVFILEHQREDLDADRRARIFTWSARAGRAAAARARAGAVVALWLATALVVVTRWGASADWAAAASVPLATAISIALIGRRYASNRRLPSRPVVAAPRGVIVHGAGLSGLVAANRLADWGVPVEIRERGPSPSDATDGPLQVHSTLQDPARMAAHLGLPFEVSFERTQREANYIFGRRFTLAPRHWNCLRGSAPGSLDAGLLAMARARGVVLQFERPWREQDRAEGCEILATGHGPAGFEAFRLPFERLDGWCAEAPWDGPPLLLAYRDHWSGAGYAYVAATRARVFALLFARGTLPPGARDEFERALEATEKICFPRWTRCAACAPGHPVFERDGYLLAGALAGFNDPLHLSGVGPALLSGGIAALGVVDREEARRRFAAFTRTFSIRRRLAREVWGAPASASRLWLAETWAAVVPPVGALGRYGTGP